MKIEQFIEEFTKAKDKEACMGSHIVTDYIDFERKIAISNLIAKKMVLDNGDLVKNTPMVYENFILTLVREYTDLEVDKKDSLKCFNLLEKFAVTECLVDAIGKDAKRFNTVLDMIIADFIDNHNNLVNYLSLKADNVDFILDKLQKVIPANQKVPVAKDSSTNIAEPFQNIK